jgi:ABC-2 type transport system ATP-binding protein
MIELQGLTKHFDDLVAVDTVSLQIKAGEVFALLGPNGAGKTTTVRMLSSILKPTAGSATVAGFDVVTEGRHVRTNVGVLTEAPGLYMRMSGWEYLDFFGEVRGLSRRRREDRIRSLANRFQFADALPRRLSEYSKGMKQKIALVRTLLHDPPVLLFDEPTSAMDPASARLVRDAIRQMRNDEGRAIIICTHNLPEAEELADRIGIIRNGAIVAEGTVDELKVRLLGPPLMQLQLRQAPENGLLPLMRRFVEIEAVGETWVRYRTADPHTTNPRLLEALAGAEIPVVTLSEVPRSLESVYLRAVESDVGLEVSRA